MAQGVALAGDSPVRPAEQPGSAGQLLTSWRQHWARRCVLVRHFNLQIITLVIFRRPPKWLLLPACDKQTFVLSGFLTLGTAAVEVTQLAGHSTILYLIRSVKYSILHAHLPLLSLRPSILLLRWRQWPLEIAGPVLLLQCVSQEMRCIAGPQPENLGRKTWQLNPCGFQVGHNIPCGTGTACLQLWES